MEKLIYQFPAGPSMHEHVQVGVVASGDLEVLLEPATSNQTHVEVTTSVQGRKALWDAVLQRIFSRPRPAAKIDINDCGATPGVVRLRIEQALELAGAPS